MQAAPLNQYVKKDVGYVLSARSGVEVVVETVDDNCPVDGFWSARTRTQGLRACAEKLAGSMRIAVSLIAPNVKLLTIERLLRYGTVHPSFF